MQSIKELITFSTYVKTTVTQIFLKESCISEYQEKPTKYVIFEIAYQLQSSQDLIAFKDRRWHVASCTCPTPNNAYNYLGQTEPIKIL